MNMEQKAKAWDTLKQGLYDMSQGTQILGIVVKNQPARDAKALFDMLVSVEMMILKEGN